MPSRSQRLLSPRLPIMPNHHLDLAGRLFLFVQLVYVFIQLQIQLECARRIERGSAASSPSPRLDNSIDALLFIQLHHPHRWWKASCSHHWIQMVLAEKTLDEGDFRKTFRMTRNSFNQLHALLGTYIFTS